MGNMDSYVVTSPCIGIKDHACVDVCPVQDAGCFLEAPKILVIDPEICIGCGACVSACPVEAIFEQGEVPAKDKHFIEYNAKMAAGRTLKTAQSQTDWERDKNTEGTDANQYYKDGHKPGDNLE